MCCKNSTKYKNTHGRRQSQICSVTVEVRTIKKSEQCCSIVMIPVTCTHHLIPALLTAAIHPIRGGVARPAVPLEDALVMAGIEGVIECHNSWQVLWQLGRRYLWDASWNEDLVRWMKLRESQGESQSPRRLATSDESTPSTWMG